ncbi:Uncharacterised protein [Candidatus Tiddalikarchaeum anstoanum]|nr:Uncharacterised protein [Candidatus Tiddalikarchaeum anstoanum]
MAKKLSLFNAIGVLLLLTQFASYLLLYFNISFGVTAIIDIAAVIFLLVNTDFKNVHVNYKLLIIIAVQALALILMTDKLTLITDSPDFYNHISVSKVVSDTDSLFYVTDHSATQTSFVHTYPVGIYTILAFLIHILPQNELITGFCSALVFMIYSSWVLYKINMKLFNNENNSLISTSLFSFSIILLLELGQGYIPSILGILYLLLVLYFFFSKEYLFSSFFFGALGLTYPHYFLIGFLFLLLNLVFNYKKEYHIYLLGLFIGTIESLQLAAFYIIRMFNNMPGLEVIFFIRGGITIPNICSVLIFIPLLYYAVKNIKMFLKDKAVLFLTIAFLIPPLVLFVIFITNYLFTYFLFFEIKQAYMVIKYAYLLIIPSSILYSKIIDKINKKLIYAAMLLYLIYFLMFPSYFKSSTKWDVDQSYFTRLVDLQKNITSNDSVCISTAYLAEKGEYNNIFYDSPFQGSGNKTFLHIMNSIKLLRNNYTIFNFSVSKNMTWLINTETGRDFVDFQQNCSESSADIKI